MPKKLARYFVAPIPGGLAEIARRRIADLRRRGGGYRLPSHDCRRPVLGRCPACGRKCGRRRTLEGAKGSFDGGRTLHRVSSKGGTRWFGTVCAARRGYAWKFAWSGFREHMCLIHAVVSDTQLVLLVARRPGRRVDRRLRQVAQAAGQVALAVARPPRVGRAHKGPCLPAKPTQNAACAPGQW